MATNPTSEKQLQPEPESDSTETPTTPPTENDSREPVINIRPDLPTTWFDHFRISSPKGLAVSVLSFYHTIGDQDQASRYELGRFMTSRDHLRNIIDALASNIDYYPTPPEPDSETAE